MLPSALRSPVLLVAAVAGVSLPALPQGYVCAEGGGSPTATGWGASVFGWIVDKGGYGDVVILGTSGSDPGVAAVFLSLGAASATNLAVDAASADLQATYDAIAAADVVWLRGGDQWEYVSQWNGTLTEDAIRDVYLSGGVVAGTSAGCAVLGELIYDARNGGVYPDEALEDPYNVYMTFTDDFLGLTPGVIFDTHFTERGRLGRLAVMVGRLHEDGYADLLGAGVDDRTALCISPDGSAEVRGEGAVTLLHRTPATQQRIEPGEPPMVTELEHVQLTEGYRFDLATRSVTARPPNAVLAPPPGADPDFDDFTLRGTKIAHAERGEIAVDDGGDPLALFHGDLQLTAGLGTLRRTVVSTRVWHSFTWDENRVGGVQYALATYPHHLGLYLDNDVVVRASEGRYLTVRPPTGTPTAFLVLDSHGLVSTAFSTYVSSASSAGPRQSVALEGARLSILREGFTYDAEEHEVPGGVPYGTGKRNSLALVPRLDWAGTPSEAVGGFELAITGAVPGQAALLFWGDAAQELPFLGGTLYVAPPFTRESLTFLDSSGAATFPVDVTPAMIGQTRFYQGWYRDPGLGLPNPVGLTNGVEVLFRP